MYKVQVRFLFHSDIKIKIPESYDDSVFDRLFGILEDVNEKYNSYAENSYIDKINKNREYVDENVFARLAGEFPQIFTT